MSPNTIFPPNKCPENPITERVLEHPRVVYDVDGDALVIAIKDELLVHKGARERSPALDRELAAIACERSASHRLTGSALHEEVEVWRLNDHGANSIDEARRLRVLTTHELLETRRGHPLDVPAVSPNHVLVVCPKYDTCPASPPNPAPGPRDGDFVAPECDPGARVVVIDTGYIHTEPPHAALDARVTSVDGEWLDTSANPPVWRQTAPDVLDADHDGRLDGVAGHGTFIAGLVAHGCREAAITVVGQRHECMPIGDPSDPVDQAMLFTSEYDVANALLMHGDADVVSLGFAFPVLDSHPSIPFTSVMQVLSGPDAPRVGVAVVAPAGNEDSARPYWPAAHPDVIGVAATNRRESARAHFSNWGAWADCCARGEDVTSTYIYWVGPVEGESPPASDDFVGWARWDGTSFAAPKVTAEIARVVAQSGGSVLPVDAFAELVGGTGGVTVTPMTDTTLTPAAGVTLPHLNLG
ncbi:MAG TPA: S8/S53 family peptidase [Solirubrobacteraceae bacterium]